MVEFDSYEWASAGVVPESPDDAIYVAGEQPVAGYDNHFNWAVSHDLRELRDHTTGHGSEHEAGGSQELDLLDLSIGGVATLSDDGDRFVLLDDTGDTIVSYDNATDRINDIATIAGGLDVVGAISLTDDLETGQGDTLYDSSTDYFHRAEFAIDADEASWATDSGLLDGTPLSEFLFADQEETLTATWSATTAQDFDITGHASTASVASLAELAEDSELLENHTVQDILNKAWQDVEDEFVDIEDGGTLQLENARTLDFDTSIDVDTDGDRASMAVTSVPHADDADHASDTDLHEGYTVNEILDQAWQDVDGEFVDVADNGTLIEQNVAHIDFQQSVDVAQISGERAISVAVESVPHADDADWAEIADVAELAENAELHENHTVSDILDLAYQDIEGELVDIRDGGATILENAREIDFQQSIDVEDGGGGRANVSVTSVPHANDADHSIDTDLHEGYTVDEIVNMASTGDGEWVFIGEHEQSLGNWSFDINIDSANIYDQYRLIVVHEYVTGSPTYSPLWTRINGDARSRYDFMKWRPIYGPSSHDGWSFHAENRDRFWVSSCDRGTVRTSEWIISCPGSISGSASSYPNFAVNNSGGMGNGSGSYVRFGQLETSYSQVDQFTFWNHTGGVAAYVKLFGRNIF